MRAVPLAKTLGVGSFAGLQAAVGSCSHHLVNALGASACGSSTPSAASQMKNQAFQHTKVPFDLCN
jgi:hypothetical protein